MAVTDFLEGTENLLGQDITDPNVDFGIGLGSVQGEDFRFRPEFVEAGLLEKQNALTISRAPQIFARLLQEEERPGGTLSPLAQDRIFGGLLEQRFGEEDRRLREQEDALAAAGVSRGFARRILGEDRLRLDRERAQLQARSELGLRGRRGAARTAFANLLAATDEQERLLGIELDLAAKARSAARNARRRASRDALIGTITAGTFNLGAALLGSDASTTAAQPTPVASPESPQVSSNASGGGASFGAAGAGAGGVGGGAAFSSLFGEDSQADPGTFFAATV